MAILQPYNPYGKNGKNGIRGHLEEKFFPTDHKFCDLKWKSMNFWNPQMLKIFGKSMV